jgi:hypothetical protein
MLAAQDVAARMTSALRRAGVPSYKALLTNLGAAANPAAGLLEPPGSARA